VTTAVHVLPAFTVMTFGQPAMTGTVVSSTIMSKEHVDSFPAMSRAV
jgi:hypothetical protein